MLGGLQGRQQQVAETGSLANAAAGFVVGVPGTATLTPEELIGAAGARA